MTSMTLEEMREACARGEDRSDWEQVRRDAGAGVEHDHKLVVMDCVDDKQTAVPGFRSGCRTPPPTSARHRFGELGALA
jgi:hypothetical protein